MAAKKQTYEQAMKRLEEIVSRIDLALNIPAATSVSSFSRAFIIL